MILGNVTHSVPSVVRRAMEALKQGGRIAVYIGSTGAAVAIGHGEPDYAMQLHRQERFLVGVWDDDLGDNEGFRAELVSSIRVHVADLRLMKVAA